MKLRVSPATPVTSGEAERGPITGLSQDGLLASVFILLYWPAVGVGASGAQLLVFWLSGWERGGTPRGGGLFRSLGPPAGAPIFGGVGTGGLWPPGSLSGARRFAS